MDQDTCSKKKSPKLALNKSASFSGSPISEKYEIKQLFKNKDGDTLVRHYSYEYTGRKKPNYQQIQQLYKYTKPSTFKSKPIENSTDYCCTPYEGGVKKEVPNIKFGTPFKHFFKFAKHVAEEKGFVESLADNVPMEIDSSVGSNTSIMDTSLKTSNIKPMADVHQQDTEPKKHRHKNKVPKLCIKPTKSIEVIKSKVTENQKNKSNLLVRVVKILGTFFIPIICALVIMYCNSDIHFIEPFDSHPIVNDLRNLLYGQDEVVNKLEYNLNIMKKNKIFVFTGGVGVGKTYAAQLIEHKYPWKNNIQKVVFNSREQYNNLEKEIINNLIKNAHNLVILDGLTMDDIYYILPVINHLSSSESRFIIIIIFNLQDNSLDTVTKNILTYKSNEISKIFNDNNIGHTVFMFQNLNEDDTKECIRYAMHKRGMDINERNVDNVLENINFKFSGCKGVYRKVSLIDYSNNYVI